MRHEAYSQRRHEMMRLCRQERKRLINVEQNVGSHRRPGSLRLWGGRSLDCCQLPRNLSAHATALERHDRITRPIPSQYRSSLRTPIRTGTKGLQGFSFIVACRDCTSPGYFIRYAASGVPTALSKCKRPRLKPYLPCKSELENARGFDAELHNNVNIMTILLTSHGP